MKNSDETFNALKYPYKKYLIYYEGSKDVESFIFQTCERNGIKITQLMNTYDLLLSCIIEGYKTPEFDTCIHELKDFRYQFIHTHNAIPFVIEYKSI